MWKQLELVRSAGKAGCYPLKDLDSEFKGKTVPRKHKCTWINTNLHRKETEIQIKHSDLCAFLQRIVIVFFPYWSLVHSTPQITRTTPYLQYPIRKNTAIIFITQQSPGQKNFQRLSETSFTDAEQAQFHSPETKKSLLNYSDCELSLPPPSLHSHHLPVTNKNNSYLMLLR